MLAKSHADDVVTCAILAEALERRELLAAQAVSDFSAPTSRGPGEAFSLGNVSYFSFNDGFRGYELWRSDAADPQGRLVRDINTGAYDASGRTSSSHPTSFFAVGTTVIFIADDGVSGRELWRTEGSAAGTYRLVESKLGYDGIESGAALAHAPFQSGAVVFTSPEMIYTDGTAPGTRVLGRNPEHVFHAGGRLYWLGPNRRSVLAFDGATLGTAFALSVSGVTGQSLSIDAQGRLIFSWQTLQGGAGSSFSQVIAIGASELARQLVAHPHVGLAPRVAANLGTFGGLAFHAVEGRGIYATDGTPGGLRRLHDRWTTVGMLAGAAGRAYFMLETGPGHRRELWETDGSSEGTRRVAQVDDEDRPSEAASKLIVAGDKLVFIARANGRWEVRGFDPNSSSQQSLAAVASDDVDLMVSSGRVFFRAGESYYASDGTTGGTRLVYRRTAASGVAPYTPFNVLGERFVVAPVSNQTDQVLDPASVFVVPGPLTSTHRFVEGFTVGDKLFLRYEELVQDAAPTFELWRTDGTAAGTIKLTDQPAQQSFNRFAAMGNLLIFSVNTADDGNEIFRSDGTKSGTHRLRDINASQADSNAHVFATTSKAAFFTADDGVNGRGVWRTDGTTRGTVLLRGFGGRLGAIESATTIGDEAYFIADDGMHGPQLWRSDGTAAGTRIVSAAASTGSAVTDLPQPTSSDALVAPAFTPTDGAEIFALDAPAPVRGPIAPPYVSNRTLRVFGSSENDLIRVSRRATDPNMLDVLVNDELHAFRFADVGVIRIYADAGDDYVEALSDLNTAVQAGAGDDIVITSSGRDTLYGGDGNDALYGGANTDWLFGEAGQDRIAGGAARDVLWGGLGVDRFLLSVDSERRDVGLDDLLR